MKYLLFKIFYFFFNPFRKIYFFIIRPHTRGVKCLIENNNKFLLVKLNYAHRKWTIPGGKVEKHESFLHAALREAKEETGMDVQNLVFIGQYTSRKEYKHDTVEVYFGNSDRIKTAFNPIEIEDAQWFPENELPDNRTASVNAIFEFYDQFRLKQN